MTDRELSGKLRPQQLGKRERLVDGPCHVLYEHGVERTTPTEIARAARGPLGNLRYYFETKDEPVEAVIATHASEIQSTLASLDDAHRTIRHRAWLAPPRRSGRP